MFGLIIVGGKAGSKLAEALGRLLGYPEVKYFETYREDIKPHEMIEYNEFYRLVRFEKYDYFVASGDNMLRKNHHIQLSRITGVEPVTLIHPSASIDTILPIGAGTLICQKVAVNVSARIGRGVILNTLSCIEHDCNVSDFAQISPGAILTGYCEIGEESFIGAGAVLLPRKKIGNRTQIGAGAVVTRDIGADMVVKGVPAK